MNVTVIVCTYNRCASLGEALESVAVSQMPADVQWEIVVVDNNSKDKTRAVVEEVSARYPGRFRYVFEQKQGLSNARNSGIQQAHGEIIAFTDDDVTVDPAWLRNLTAPLLQDPQWAGAGGKVRTDNNFSVPAWLALSGPFSLAQSLALFDQGDNDGELTEPPFGANMAFRKSMFQKYGGFRTDLGRCGKNLIGNEDTEFGGRLKAGGERLRSVSSAIVYHPVLEERLQKKYFRSYWFAHGRSMIRQAGQRRSLRSVPRYLLKDLRNKLNWMSRLERRWYLNPQARFFFELHMRHTLGEIVEGCRQERAAAKAANDPVVSASA